jgi:putative FmdB family regulatory protein
MPTYYYECNTCETSVDKMFIPIDERDNQVCEECKNQLTRTLKIGNVSVWAPTSGGYR